MRTKSTYLVASFILTLGHYSANAQCEVTITGEKEVGAKLRAKTGECHVESLTWQLNSQTVYIAGQRQFAKKGSVAAGGNEYGSGSNQLASPTDVQVDVAGNVYVLDANNNRVQKWAPGATEGITVAGGNGLGSGANQFFLPQGLFVDADGNMYVADLFNNRVQKWNAGATTGVTVAGGNGFGAAANQLANPRDVFVDTVGNVYVSDGDNNRVQKWAPGATAGTTVAGGNGYGSEANQFKNPYSLFVDRNGNVYVSDKANYRVQKWAPGATAGETVAAGNYGEDSSELNDPRGLFVDNFGRVYIADYFNNRIQKWVNGMPYGYTIAGGLESGETDKTLNHPSGVFVSPGGDLYVTDEGNNRVQHYSLTNRIQDNFIPESAGTYRVIAVCPSGLVDTSDEVIITGKTIRPTSGAGSLLTQKNTSGAASVFPNPAPGFTNIKFTAAKQEPVTIQLTDLSGSVVLRKNIIAVAGDNQVRLDLGRLVKGTYIINLVGKDAATVIAKLNKL